MIDLVREQCAEEDIWTRRGGNTERMEIINILHSFMIYTVANYYCDQITEYVMCQACSIHGRNEKYSKRFGQKSWKATPSWKP